ncbi:ADP-ribose glycohydrolase MACROD2 [Dissostichus eleginoides]|uniref:ADP-ribose glycohydrolase MACROD2 n=1 Tax=Dissostichus eleginoides TaxID=100907 RepID=A0AAD9CQG2_DISEL|nr:ADP-ribose glycohydrolase MACROD2 [Dissostichus eleginoides]
MSKKKKDWKTEKERLLRLDREERRKEYRRQDFISLDKIPAWREETRPNDKEEVKELTDGGGPRNKVSLYKGDITVLEVDAIVNAGKDLPFDLWELLDGVCCLKAARLLNCPWLPSTVESLKVIFLRQCTCDECY